MNRHEKLRLNLNLYFLLLGTAHERVGGLTRPTFIPSNWTLCAMRLAVTKPFLPKTNWWSINVNIILLRISVSQVIVFLLSLKFIYSEKATKFCEIFPLLLTTVHTVKSKEKISQNFVAFSEYMNFKYFGSISRF